MNKQTFFPKNYPIGFLISVIICSITMGLLFLPHQTLWVDETTQLTGIGQSFQELFSWLLRKNSDLGVPYDRAPPMSYILDKLWCSLFTYSPNSLRVMGILVVAVGAGFLFHTAYVNVGKWSAVASGLLFALSPNIIVIENEIRSYPLFLCFSTIGFFLYIGLIKRVSKKQIIYLIIVSLLTIYTHYYGVVFSSAIFSSLIIFHWFAGKYQDLKSIALGFSVVIIGALGVIPFILAAHSSNINPDTKSFTDVIRLAYRMVAHSSMTLQPVVIIASLASVVVTISYVMIAKTPYRKYTLALALPIILGFIATAGAHFMLNTFKATTITYSAWMFPGIFLLLGAGFFPASRWWVKGCTSIVILSYGFGAYILITWGSFFSHGPSEAIAKMIQKAPRNTQAIVYEDNSDQIGMTFFPLNYFFGTELAQYYYDRPELEGLMNRLDYSSSEDLFSHLGNYDYIYVLTIKAQHAKDIINNIKTGVKRWPMGKVGKALHESPNWTLVKSPTIISMTGAQVYLFKKEKSIFFEKQQND